MTATSTPASAEPAADVAGALSLARRTLGSARLAWSVLGQRRFAKAGAAAITAAQQRRLRAIVEHAYRTVPYYADTMRAQGLRPEHFRSVDDLELLPLVERAHIQQEPERFRSRARAKSEYLALRTGGSSGAPCVVYHDPQSVLENAAQGARHLAIMHALVGTRRLRVLAISSPRSSDVELRRFVRRYALVPSAVAARTVRSMADRPEDVARDLATIRPHVVLTYGSYVERLAQVLEEARGAFHVPPLFAYGGDALSAAARKRIVEVLGARVWSTYQAAEALKIAFECERHGGLHVHADLCAVRVVDAAGQGVPPGTAGDVVISNLVNRGTVLLNYRLGDRAALAPEPCACGRVLPLLGFPVGRVEDWLEAPSGERVYTQRLRAVFTDEEQVWQYQIVEQAPGRLRVAVVASADADRPAIAARVGAGLAQALGPGVVLDIDFVADVERTPTGKVRVIVRRAAPASDAQPATPRA